MEIHLNVHQLQLPGDDDFARRFNAVSDLFDRAFNPIHNLSPEAQQGAEDDYFSAKACLEQGY